MVIKSFSFLDYSIEKSLPSSTKAKAEKGSKILTPHNPKFAKFLTKLKGASYYDSKVSLFNPQSPDVELDNHQYAFWPHKYSYFSQRINIESKSSSDTQSPWEVSNTTIVIHDVSRNIKMKNKFMEDKPSKQIGIKQLSRTAFRPMSVPKKLW